MSLRFFTCEEALSVVLDFACVWFCGMGVWVIYVIREILECMLNYLALHLRSNTLFYNKHFFTFSHI